MTIKQDDINFISIADVKNPEQIQVVTWNPSTITKISFEELSKNLASRQTTEKLSNEIDEVASKANRLSNGIAYIGSLVPTYFEIENGFGRRQTINNRTFLELFQTFSEGYTMDSGIKTIEFPIKFQRPPIVILGAPEVEEPMMMINLGGGTLPYILADSITDSEFKVRISTSNYIKKIFYTAVGIRSDND